MGKDVARRTIWADFDDETGEENPQDLSQPRVSIYLKLNHLIFVINFLLQPQQ